MDKEMKMNMRFVSRVLAVVLFAACISSPAGAEPAKKKPSGYAGVIAPRPQEDPRAFGTQVAPKAAVPGVIGGKPIDAVEKRRLQLLKNINTVDTLRDEAIVNMGKAYDAQQRKRVEATVPAVMAAVRRQVAAIQIRMKVEREQALARIKAGTPKVQEALARISQAQAKASAKKQPKIQDTPPSVVAPAR